MNSLTKRRKPKLILLFSGLILIALSFAIALLMLSLRYDELWYAYDEVLKTLDQIEVRITELEYTWEFVGAILLLFAIKSFIPIYPTSTVCFLTGIVLPMYLAVPVNILGFSVLLSIRYFVGRRFGAGNAWKVISKWGRLRNLIQRNGKGNSPLLIALRLVPGVPINTISAVYGSFDFGYAKYLLFSIVGFMPRLLSFTFVGRNVFDPLSPGFLVPLMIISFVSGIAALSVNGVWIGVEKTVKYAKGKKQKKMEGIEENENVNP